MYKTYEARPSTTRPLNIRVREYLNNNNIKFFKILNYGFNKFPPWQIPSAVCHTELTEYKKQNTPTAVYTSGFQNVINQYDNAVMIFTDGSKSEAGVGCALVTGNTTKKWSFPRSTSIYTAELFAIHRALELIRKMPRNGDTVLICSDSLSAIYGIKRKFSSDPLIQLITDSLWSLNDKGRKVIFVWTPGHTGIKGNERADKAAGEAAMIEKTELERVRPADLILEVKKITKDTWQSDWDRKQTKLKNIKPKVGTWVMPRTLQRKETVALTRLRIGHTRLTHSYLFDSQTPPICHVCRVQTTVEHILVDCRKYRRQRKSIKLANKIEEILGPEIVNINKVIRFCKEIKLLQQL